MDDPADVTVFLLDDHEVVRRGLAELLGSQAGVRVVGEAATVAEALARLPAVHPDVAILDARLPDGSGIDVCRDIRSAMPDVRCLILTSYDDNDAVLAAIMAGASGYLLKQIHGDALIEAVRRIAAGESLLDPAMTVKVLDRLRHPVVEEDPRYAALTEQERRILAEIAEGKTNRQIAQSLYLAEKTVKNYVSSLLRKLNVERRTEAAVFAIEHANKNPQS